MITRTYIINSYKKFFGIENMFLAEDDHIVIDWVESLIEDKRSSICETNSDHVVEVRSDVELALKLSKHVHDVCKEVPHDIGLKLTEIVSEHFDQREHTQSKGKQNASLQI